MFTYEHTVIASSVVIFGGYNRKSEIWDFCMISQHDEYIKMRIDKNRANEKHYE